MTRSSVMSKSRWVANKCEIFDGIDVKKALKSRRKQNQNSKIKGAKSKDPEGTCRQTAGSDMLAEKLPLDGKCSDQPECSWIEDRS